jgi:hypothetical protein
MRLSMLGLSMLGFWPKEFVMSADSRSPGLGSRHPSLRWLAAAVLCIVALAPIGPGAGAASVSFSVRVTDSDPFADFSNPPAVGEIGSLVIDFSDDLLVTPSTSAGFVRFASVSNQFSAVL